MRSRLFAGLAILVAASTLLIGCNSASNSGDGVKRLNGGGATFVQPIMELWAYEYKIAKGVEVDYQAKGSGQGIQQMTSQTYHFGCSDAPMKKPQLEKAMETGGEVIHIPLIMGPVVPAYNVPGLDQPLVFDGKLLADIYMGKVKKWNDDAIKALNPEQQAKLPDLEISPVFRAEASGTTNIFKEFLAKSSAEFKASVGISTEPTWTKGVGTGERENSGVAGRVKSSAGAIGYVEIRFAKQNDLSFGAVKNRAGKPILGGADGVVAAAANAMKEKQESEPYSLHELTYSITDAAGDDSYPISGISYCVIYKKQKEPIGRALKEFLRWATHEGQAMADKLDYAPLPEELVKKIDARLEQITLEP